MAELIIRLRVDPTTRKKTLFIDYQSDEDALPMEHEAAHRELVDRVLAGAGLDAGSVSQVVVRRGTQTVSTLNLEATREEQEAEAQLAHAAEAQKIAE